VTIVLITGGDEPLVAEAVRDAVNAAVVGEDRSLAVEVLTEDDYRVDHEFAIACLVDAAQTVPFLTTRRVVVGRHIGRFGRAEAVGPLVSYLAAPLPTTSLVLVWEKGLEPVQQRLGPVPKALTEAVVATGGEVMDCDIRRGRDADRWLARRFDEAEIDLNVQARDLIVERIGEDRSRIVDAGDVAPYLGEAGGVAPWELTDTIDAGDVPAAIDRLHRMLGAGGRHPLAVLAVLHLHYERLLRLDGSGIKDERAAAETLGVSTFPAKKALTVSRRLGAGKIARALRLLADADLDLRGRTAWPPELVVEVLVARLATISRR
jgi:DNA polymerase-3 subunit delta